MTPERLSEIRALSKIEVRTFNSFTEERPSSGEMQAALREVLAEHDSAKVYADRRTVEISELEARIADLVAELNGASGRAQQADERAQRASRRVPTSKVRSRISEFDSLNPGDVVGAKGEEYTVGERDFPRDRVMIRTVSGNEYLLSPETWLGSYDWKLISRATETGNETTEEPTP